MLKQIKEGVNKMNEAAQTFSAEVIGSGVDFFCKHSGAFGEYAAKGFGFVKCNEQHEGEGWCKSILISY